LIYFVYAPKADMSQNNRFFWWGLFTALGEKTILEIKKIDYFDGITIIWLIDFEIFSLAVPVNMIILQCNKRGSLLTALKYSKEGKFSLLLYFLSDNILFSVSKKAICRRKMILWWERCSYQRKFLIDENFFCEIDDIVRLDL